MADLLLDTDVFADHPKGARELDPRNHRVHYSVITRAELLAGTTASDSVTILLRPFREIPVDRSIAERAGRIRRETGVRLSDALIAATAIEGGFGLVTRNRSDFERTRGLRLRVLSSTDKRCAWVVILEYTPSFAVSGLRPHRHEAHLSQSHNPGIPVHSRAQTDKVS